MTRVRAGAVCLLFLVGATASGVALGEDSVREAPARDAAARGGILFAGHGALFLARGRQRVRLAKGVGAWSPDRRLFAYIVHDGHGHNVLGVSDARGHRRPLVTVNRSRRLQSEFSFGGVSWSPDSSRLAYAREVPGGEESEGYFFTVSLAGGGETRIPLPADIEWGGPALWSPTDDVIALHGSGVAPSGGFEHGTWLVDPDGSTQPRRLVRGIDRYTATAEAWAPDGRKLAVQLYPRGLHVVDVSTGAAKLVFPGTFFSDVDWAPDSRRLAFTMVPGGARGIRDDVRVVNADGTGLRDPTQTPKRLSDEKPVWSPDGRRLAFIRFLSPEAIKGRRTAERLARIYRANPSRTLVVPSNGGRSRRLQPLRDSELINDWR